MDIETWTKINLKVVLFTDLIQNICSLLSDVYPTIKYSGFCKILMIKLHQTVPINCLFYLQPLAFVYFSCEVGNPRDVAMTSEGNSLLRWVISDGEHAVECT